MSSHKVSWESEGLSQQMCEADKYRQSHIYNNVLRVQTNEGMRDLSALSQVLGCPGAGPVTLVWAAQTT